MAIANTCSCRSCRHQPRITRERPGRSTDPACPERSARSRPCLRHMADPPRVYQLFIAAYRSTVTAVGETVILLVRPHACERKNCYAKRGRPRPLGAPQHGCWGCPCAPRLHPAFVRFNVSASLMTPPSDQGRPPARRRRRRGRSITIRPPRPRFFYTLSKYKKIQMHILCELVGAYSIVL